MGDRASKMFLDGVMGHLMECMGLSFVAFNRTLRFSYVLVKEVMVNMVDGTTKHAAIIYRISKLMLLSCH